MTKKGYLHPMKTYLWITLFVTGVMSGLWFVMGISPGALGTIPPAFSFGASDMFFHSIGIGIASVAAIIVIIAFDLEKYEPSIDFPIAYRATLATIIGAVGGFFFLTRGLHSIFDPLPFVLVFLGLVLLWDVGGALMIQLYILPARLSGKYVAGKNMLGFVPRWSTLPKWSDFRKMDGSYHLTFVAVTATFIAGTIGIVTLLLNYVVITFHITPTFFDAYVDWLGGASTFLDASMGAHSHLIGMTLILGIVAITAKRFGVLNTGGAKRKVANLGLWVSGIGIVIMTFVFLLEAFAAYAPPLIFASDPGGSFQLWSSTAANGMAGDDATMFLASAGAMVMLVPLLLTPIGGRPAWKDPLRMSILATWVFAYIATPIEGFFIEFNESTLSGGPTDVVFGNQQYFALFGITMVTVAFLAADFFLERKGSRNKLAALGMGVTAFTVVAGFIYAYFDPGVLNPIGTIAGASTWGWVYSGGLLLVSLVVIMAVVAILRGSDEPITHPSTLSTSP